MKMLSLIVAAVLCVALPSYAEIELKQLYGLREKAALQEFAQKTENEIGNGSSFQKLKMLGIAYHNLATLNVKDASRKAVAYLQKALSLSPDDNEVRAYLGSAATMAGRDSWNVLAKLPNVNKGIKMMDEAAAELPDNIPIRMVRANNSLDLPKFFKREVIAKKDFQHLEMLIAKSPPDIEPDIKAEVFYKLGMLYKQEGNALLANEYFKKAINSSPDSQWGKNSERSLQP
jgi:tetratricopeptide (TPR) repeat protein